MRGERFYHWRMCCFSTFYPPYFIAPAARVILAGSPWQALTLLIIIQPVSGTDIEPPDSDDSADACGQLRAEEARIGGIIRCAPGCRGLPRWPNALCDISSAIADRPPSSAVHFG